MRNRITITLSAALALTGAAALAQAPAASGPSPEMKRLDFLAGKWNVSGKGNLLGVTPIESQGTDETTWVLGGQYLLGRSTVTSPGQPASESLRLIGYDSQTKQYRIWLFGSVGMPPGEASGHFEGGKLVLAPVVRPATAGGFGITPERTPEGYVRIRGVLPGGAAAKAGLKEGDLITQIDGAPLSPTTPGLLPGRVGTRVHLMARSGGQERAVTLTRQGMPPIRGAMGAPSDGAGRLTAAGQARRRGAETLQTG